nr:MAG TPA: hypothetical protein [Caudoviricetes sp.]DAQ60921.1 MAG TPA: hypothetical protein [Caudoviricetes sp.]
MKLIRDLNLYNSEGRLKPIQTAFFHNRSNFAFKRV